MAVFARSPSLVRLMAGSDYDLDFAVRTEIAARNLYRKDKVAQLTAKAGIPCGMESV